MRAGLPTYGGQQRGSGRARTGAPCTERRLFVPIATSWKPIVLAGLPAAVLTIAGIARADAVTDSNVRAAEIASTIRLTPVAVRAMALVQVSVFDAVQSIEGHYRPLIAAPGAKSGASVDAAVAAATRAALLATIPGQKEAIETDYQAALAKLATGPAKSEGIAAGERAAAAVLAARARDGADAPATYTPRTTPGVYVPTGQPIVPHWGRRTPWVMSAGSQFRPAPPPRLDSETWHRDLTEVKALGGLRSTTRTPEQTAIARFWNTTSPSVYWPVVRSVALARATNVSESARLLAEAAIAMDDALIAVFDAKYAFEFWRPITAIRNGASDVSDPGWEPLIETPMHPEYPCAHCIVSASVGAVLEAAIGSGPSPRLRSTSPTGEGVERSWSSPAEFVREVSEARIYAGVHYRNSTDVGQAMGRRIGELVVRRLPDAELRANSPPGTGR